MANETHTVTLTGRDNLSRVFTAAGRSAQQMGTTVQQSASISSRALDGLRAKSIGVGAATTTLMGIVSDSARAYGEAEASQARLEQAIENTGHSLFEYEDALDAASKAALQLGFDDEDAADAIAKLTTVTGDATRAIADLALAEDIARARKIDLAAATNIVIAAEQGRFGALARMGVAIDENSTKEQALDQLRAKFAGNAASYAETQAASLDRARNAFENIQEEIGSHAGQLTTVLALLPGLSAGYTLVGGALGAMAKNAKVAQTAATALGLATSPIGLLAIGATAAGVAFIKLTDNADSFGDAAAEASVHAGDLTTVLGELANIGSQQFFVGQAWQAQLEAAGLSAETLKEQIEAADQAQQQTASSADALEARYVNLIAAQTALGQILSSTAPGAVTAINDINLAFQQMQDGLITVDQLLNFIITSAANIPQYSAALLEAAEATNKFGQTANDVTKTVDLLTKATEDFASIKIPPGLAEDLEAIGSATGGMAESQRANALAAIKAYEDQAISLADLESRIDTYADAVLISQVAQARANGLNRDAAVILDGVAEASIAAAFGQSELATGIADTSGAQRKFNEDMATGAGVQQDYDKAINLSVSALGAMARESNHAAEATRGVASATEVAANAQAAFKGMQDGLIQNQTIYTHQQSEYGQQLSAITEAEDLLNARREAGVELTAEQIDFLDRANAGQERLTGGVEDATIAQGMLALAYAENMKIGDALNTTMGGVDGTLQGLTASVDALTLALGGVPPETNANVSVFIDTGGLAGVVASLNALDGRTFRTSLINTVVNETLTAFPGMQQHGGMVTPRFAQHGMMGGGWTVTGEAGWELENKPYGTQTLPHTASVEHVKGMGGGGHPFYNYGTIHVHANNPAQFYEAMRARATGQARS